LSTKKIKNEKNYKKSNIQNICGRFKTVRKSLGFKTGKSFAGEMGIKYSTYINYEEKRIPPSDMLFLIKNKYPHDIDINWILSGYNKNRINTADPAPGDVVSGAEADPTLRELLEQLRYMRERLKEAELKLKK